MAFNVKKGKVMSLTEKRQPFVSDYFLTILFWKKLKNSKTWELQLSTILTGTRHIDIIVSKANRMLGLIKRTCRGLDDTKTLRTLFCALVRLNVAYCSVAWSPYTKNNIAKVESTKKSNQVHFKD